MTSSTPIGKYQASPSGPTRRSSRARSPPKKLGDNSIADSRKNSVAALTINSRQTGRTSIVNQEKSNTTKESPTSKRAVEVVSKQFEAPKSSRMIVLRYSSLMTEIESGSETEYNSNEEMVPESMTFPVNREMEEAAWILNQMKRRTTVYYRY